MSEHVQDRLSAFLDAELPAREREAVEAHLRTCPACAGHLALLRAVDAGARALPVSVPPGYFEALPGRIRGRLDRTARPPLRRLPMWTWAAAAALLLGVVTPLTVSRGLLRQEPAAAPYPAATVMASPEAALPAADGFAPSAGVEARGEPALEALVAAKDSAEAQLRKGAHANRADRPEPAPTALGARTLEEADAKAEAPKVQDSLVAEQERPAAAPALRPRRAGPGGPSAQQQAPLQSQTAPAFAPPPAVAPAESGAVAKMGESSPEEAQAPREKAVGGTVAGRVSSAGGASDERAFRRLAEAAPPTTLAALRERREMWRAFTREFPSSPRADEARVRVVETGAEAWRVGAELPDLVRLREDAAAYLARRDAPQAARVRALLEGLPAGP